MQAVSDKYLMSLWRKAVLKMWGNKCAYCGHDDVSQIECHHRVHRNNYILRWDAKNGIPACKVTHYKNRGKYNGKSCHQYADSLAGKREVKKHEAYLSMYENITLKQYLALTGMNNAEFRRHKLAELKKILGVT